MLFIFKSREIFSFISNLFSINKQEITTISIPSIFSSYRTFSCFIFLSPLWFRCCCWRVRHKNYSAYKIHNFLLPFLSYLQFFYKTLELAHFNLKLFIGNQNSNFKCILYLAVFPFSCSLLSFFFCCFVYDEVNIMRFENIYAQKNLNFKSNKSHQRHKDFCSSFFDNRITHISSGHKD